jgi:hypothetical protein
MGVLMLVRVRVGGVHVRLVVMGVMSTCVPSQCEWSALARGLFFYDEVVGVLNIIARVVFTFSYLIFTYRGVPAAGGGMANTAGFKESNRISFL